MRTRLAAVVAAMCFAAVVSGSVEANAQTSGFADDRFDPSERGSEWFVLESLDLRGAFRPAVGIVGDYAYRPLAFYNSSGNVVSNLVSDQLFVHVGASFVLADRVRFGLSVPIALLQDGSGNAISGISYAPPGSASVGDPRLGVDVRLLGQYGDPITVGAGVQVYLPAGSQAQYTGDGSVRVQPRLLAAGEIGLFAYAAKVGFEYRGLNESFAGTQLGSEVPFAVAAGVHLDDHKLLIGPELYGSTIVTSSQGAFQTDNTPLEAILGAHYLLADAWRVGIGGGAGLTRGLGSPTARGVLSVEWVPPIEKPQPPPPPPEPSDRDNDGVPDAEDACPDTPGVKTDDPKTNGCPPDRDKDGIPDAEDACPDTPGIKTDDPKTNGCPPDPDRDKDGIPNELDACPDVPGKPDPDPKKNGCPKAFVQGNQIKILDQVKFKTGSAQILPGKDSQDVLQAVLDVLQKHPEIKKVRVEGHTDNVGTAALNKKLSTDRAASVVKWLVAHGIDASRLESEGFGLERPIADNTTVEGRRENRRVEFHIEP